MVRFPEIKVKFTGQNGNAFNLLAIAVNTARNYRRMGYEAPTEDDLNQFTDEAMSGDYNNLLEVCNKWFILL